MPLMLAALALLLVLPLPIAAESARREAQNVALPDYRGDWYTVPTAINNRGAIAGWAMNEAGETVAFFRTAKGRYRKVAGNASATDLNDRGVVVGVRYPCDDAECPPEGFVWSAKRGLQSLGSFLPLAVNDKGDMAGVCVVESQACVLRDNLVSAVAEPGSVALGINARGEVVGSYGENRAFYLSADWEFRDLGRAYAEDINDKGVIAGHRFMPIPGRGDRAVLTAWRKGRPRSPAREVSLGIAINKQGWLIANAWNQDERPYSFAWNAATGARVRLSGEGDDYVEVADINDHGVVVGTSGLHAAMWTLRK